MVLPVASGGTRTGTTPPVPVKGVGVGDRSDAALTAPNAVLRCVTCFKLPSEQVAGEPALVDAPVNDTKVARGVWSLACNEDQSLLPGGHTASSVFGVAEVTVATVVEARTEVTYIALVLTTFLFPQREYVSTAVRAPTPGVDPAPIIAEGGNTAVLATTGTSLPAPYPAGTPSVVLVLTPVGVPVGINVGVLQGEARVFVSIRLVLSLCVACHPPPAT